MSHKVFHVPRLYSHVSRRVERPQLNLEATSFRQTFPATLVEPSQFSAGLHPSDLSWVQVPRAPSQGRDPPRTPPLPPPGAAPRAQPARLWVKSESEVSGMISSPPLGNRAKGGVAGGGYMGWFT